MQYNEWFAVVCLGVLAAVFYAAVIPGFLGAAFAIGLPSVMIGVTAAIGRLHSGRWVMHFTGKRDA